MSKELNPVIQNVIVLGLFLGVIINFGEKF